MVRRGAGEKLNDLRVALCYTAHRNADTIESNQDVWSHVKCSSADVKNGRGSLTKQLSLPLNRSAVNCLNNNKLIVEVLVRQ